MISMKLDKKKDEKDMSIACSEMSKPEYPYGLCIRLEKEQLEKLNMNELPEVGQEMPMKIIAKVSEVSSRQYEKEDHKTVELQITDISTGEKKESKAKTLYGDES